MLSFRPEVRSTQKGDRRRYNSRHNTYIHPNGLASVQRRRLTCSSRTSRCQRRVERTWGVTDQGFKNCYSIPLQAGHPWQNTPRAPGHPKMQGACQPVTYLVDVFSPVNHRGSHQGCKCVWWSSMSQEIKEIVAKCRHCLEKSPSEKKEPFIPSKLPEYPFPESGGGSL